MTASRDSRAWAPYSRFRRRPTRWPRSSGGLGGWVPGTTPSFLPAGIAMPLPKNSDLILQTHFHPNGAHARREDGGRHLFRTARPTVR